MAMKQTKIVAGIKIPDSTVAQQATELLLEHGSPLLFNHSLRSFVFASLNGNQKNLTYDPELLYVSSVFHDLGLCPHYRSADKAFEVDGANAARDFLRSHGFPVQALQLVWDAIAIHTMPAVAAHKEPEVALLNYGVALDVVGKGYQQLTDEHRAQILQAYPRTDFKKSVIPTFFEGFKNKTDTTYGTMNADICAFMIPNFQPKNFCDLILHSPWEE
jgi:hypothetical protein